MFDRIEADRVVWDGDEGGMARADVIIWATGFDAVTGALAGVAAAQN